MKLDKHKALQILINLISNAKDAMEEKPKKQRHLYVRLLKRDKVELPLA